MAGSPGRSWKRNVGNVSNFAVGAGNYDVFGPRWIAIRIAKEKRNRNREDYYYRAKRLEAEQDQNDSDDGQSERHRNAFGRDTDRARDAREYRARRRAPAVSLARHRNLVLRLIDQPIAREPRHERSELAADFFHRM